MNARRWKKSRVLRGDGSERSGSLWRLNEDLPGLRLPLSLHRRRRRALVPQPRRAARGRGARGHLPDAAPVGARRARRGSAAYEWWPSARAWALYARARATARSCRRSCSALGVLWHLLRRGRRYDVVHTASFPYFSLLAAARRADAWPLSARGRLVRGLDAATTGSSTSARSAAGSAYAVQALCLRVPAARLLLLAPARAAAAWRAASRGEPTMLEGVYAGSLEAREPEPAEPLVVFAGRHIPEKRVPALVPAIAARTRPTAPTSARDLRRRAGARTRARARVDELGLDEVVSRAGLRRRRRGRRARCAAAGCMVLPSRREGYGMIVIEAAAAGTPSVVVRGDDNAATELDRGGRERLRRAVRITGGPCRRDPAGAGRRHGAAPLDRRLVRANARRLSLESSLEKVALAYRGRPPDSARS